MSRTRNSAWNLSAAVAYAAASAAATLLATPLLLRWLGAERLGASKALTDGVGYLALFEIGMGGAMMASLARRIGLGDQVAVTQTLAAGLRSYRFVMVAQLVAGAAMVVALPYLISRTQLSSAELRIAGAVAVAFFVCTPLLVFRALAEARQRSYLTGLLMTAQVGATTALALFAAYMGWGLVGQSLAVTLAQVPTVLVLAWDGTRAYRDVWTARSDRTDRSEILKLSWPTLVHGLTDRIGMVSDNILIAWALGPAAVAPFFLTQQLAAFGQMQLKGVGAATWAGLTELHARGDHATFNTRVLELTGMVSGLGLAVLVPIAAFNPLFVRLWVGNASFAGEAVTLLACVNGFLWAVYALWGWTLLGTGHIRRWMPFAVFATLVNVVASLIATVKVGMVGPLVGTTLGFLLVTSWALPRTLGHVFGMSAWTLWRTALAPLAWGVPYAAGLWAVSHYLPPTNWLGLVAAAGLGTAVGLALWWSLSLDAVDRRAWTDRLKGVMSR